MKLSLPPKQVEKLVWVPVISFCKIFNPSYAFDALLCRNWPFSPPNRLTLWRTPMYKNCHKDLKKTNKHPRKFQMVLQMGPFQALGNNTKKRLTKTTFTKQTFSKFVHLISLPWFCLNKNLKSSFTFICTNLFHIQHLSIDLLSAYWIIPPHSLTQKANVISFEKLYVFGSDIAQLIALVLF